MELVKHTDAIVQLGQMALRPFFRNKLKDYPVSIWITYGKMYSSPAVVGFLERDYHQQSVAS
jgi:hypothetical protein